MINPENIENLPVEIRHFLMMIRKDVYLKESELYEPSDFHITISYRKQKVITRENNMENSWGGLEPIPYVDYNPVAKKILGINKELATKLIKFFQHTGNINLINSVKENLQP